MTTKNIALEEQISNILEEKKDYITDNDLLSNPFFTTLTPID